jgi:sigma-B regulation protein RsbU (phosphoserine phosphatase)
VSISISNSILFQDLSDLKDKLEDKVIQRTEDLLRTKEEVETVNEELTRTNRELEEARKLSEMDMEMAVHVQKSLLPREIPGSEEWDIALEFRPISGVSGDIYDFYSEGGRLLGVSILDVSGHGIASGLITILARSLMNRYFFAFREKKLSALFYDANQELIDEISASNKYLTGIMLRFNGNTVEYVNAGHPDLVLKRGGTGRSRIVNLKDRDFKGEFLGVDGMGSSFESIKFTVDRGDVLIGFSDCLVEAQNSEGRPYGMKRIVESAGSAPSGAARDIMDHILHDVYSFMGGVPLNDDLTIIIARRI